MNKTEKITYDLGNILRSSDITPLVYMHKFKKFEKYGINLSDLITITEEIKKYGNYPDINNVSMVVKKFIQNKGE
tara:strand:+ start:78 stop:302 length:225 start_codon:yes stop_codon:yes gene_type:complete